MNDCNMTVTTKFAVGTLPEPLQVALELPGGARFYRCALQVNPFGYLIRHQKPTTFESEADYNKAIIDKCQELKIEVIGVTDHYRVRDSLNLLREARNAGIHAFGGFEAVTKDGVHFLCLFDENQEDSLETFIGNCGIHDMDINSPIGELDSSELLEKSKTWGAVCIAAHVTTNGGLLTKLSGQTRVNVWRSPNLLACAIPKSVGDVPNEGFKQILMNKDSEHKRQSAMAIVNALDVFDPSDLDKDGASCFIKMSNVSVEAFRQAFLDSASRIRLNSDPEPKARVELLAMSWEGGFLRDTAIRFNGNLNAIVGGRGTGKSTMIESLRYVLTLDPITEDARKAHESVVRHVLKPGTKLSLIVRAHKPTERDYLIERSVPNPPIVKDTSGEVLSILPRDVIPNVEVYGQHEISELTKSPEKLTILLKRFVENDPSMNDRKVELVLELEKSRKRITDVQSEIESLEDRLATLPALQEAERHFKQSGLEDRLKEKSLLVKEEHLFSELIERLELYRTINENLSENLPIDTIFVSYKALAELPNSNLLVEIEEILNFLSTKLKAVSDQYAKELSEAEGAINSVKMRWHNQREAIEKKYEELLRELQKSEIDGTEFIQNRKRIEKLLPLKEATGRLNSNLTKYKERRSILLNQWEEIKAAEFRLIEKAARKASNELRDRVRIKVSMAGDRRPLEKVLREVGGNLAAALQRLRELDQLSLPEFVAHCLDGKDSLMKYYNFPSGAAERIAGADRDLFMRIEELELPATTQIELNTAADGAPAAWQTLEALSTGQKATAILLLLLQDSEAPLVVDQPEDDLDNRFIAESVVPIMRREKQQRQLVFSTHNANIPVLGDAEQILGLDASGEAEEGQARIDRNHMGSIDSLSVRELIEEVLEGGKDAFEMRRSKYGF